MRHLRGIIAACCAALALSTAPAVATIDRGTAPVGRSGWVAGTSPHDLTRAAAVSSTSYDLGVRLFPQPQEGRFAEMPIRLWGAIAAPTGPGPYPLVVLAHGAHGDNCPVEDDADTWPCFDREKRSDLGLGYLAESLAARGMVVVAPDVNAAYTGGWGESAGQEYRRFNQVVRATVEAVTDAGSGSQPIPGADLAGKVDASRVGVLGHSRGGYNMVRWARANPEVQSLFLLAPYAGGRMLPDVPTTVTVGTCDGDTHQDGLKYAVRGGKQPGRKTRLVALTASGLNHNYFNRTLAEDGDDDAVKGPGCSREERPRAGRQQRWVIRVAGAHFAASLVRPARVAPWLQVRSSRTLTLEGIRTVVRRY